MSIEIAASGFARGPVAVMVQERGHAFPQDISARECLQISLRHGIFSIYPGTYLIVLPDRSEEHTSELQSLMRISSAVFCLKKKTNTTTKTHCKFNKQIQIQIINA